jgi:hypothetical protein
MYSDISVGQCRTHSVSYQRALINNLDWIGEESMQMTWGTQDSSNMIYHHAEPKEPLPMVDTAGKTDDGTAYYATAKASEEL